LVTRAFSELHLKWLRKIMIVNVRDLIFCHRQVVFKEMNQVPEPKYDNQNMQYGRYLNLVFQQFLESKYPGSFEIEKPVHYNCSNFQGDYNYDYILYVAGKVDFYNEKTGPIEFKTTKTQFRMTKANSHDVQQTKYYMAMTNSNEGRIVYYQSDPKFTGDPVIEFIISLTDEELYSEHRRLVLESISLSKALSLERPDLASHIFYDSNMSKWKCKSCSFADECKAMRIAANGFRPKGVA
jgi:CRISPR/Cas system-associated exonuclease Cas4 (RecB family)